MVAYIDCLNSGFETFRRHEETIANIQATGGWSELGAGRKLGMDARRNVCEQAFEIAQFQRFH